MTPLQLSFLNDVAATPIDQLGKKKQAKSQQTQTILVESSCSTHRAAELLQISVSTLYRARNASKEYKYGKWIARSIGANAWNVSLQHTA
ncbi:hypothetical protein [Pseudanabaena sp. UWO310]|uniref:hypothetical protein n=1 Tax=Pseudanabaena sp. UWO310 TaxID=2480795 RepID=UPI0011592766|nr:hypothetical protein [Pseudanabaena sp. UWO310]TYQ26090.1 hypothetical protein PseudUWO310_17970 [Pseudanabaena sp. UWO310]